MHTEGILPITTTEIWSLKDAEAFMLLANVDTSETSTYMHLVHLHSHLQLRYIRKYTVYEAITGEESFSSCT